MPQNAGKSTTEQIGEIRDAVAAHHEKIEAKVDGALESIATTVGRLSQLIVAFEKMKHTALWLAAGLVAAVYIIVKVL